MSRNDKNTKYEIKFNMNNEKIKIRLSEDENQLNQLIEIALSRSQAWTLIGGKRAYHSLRQDWSQTELLITESTACLPRIYSDKKNIKWIWIKKVAHKLRASENVVYFIVLCFCPFVPYFARSQLRSASSSSSISSYHYYCVVFLVVQTVFAFL